jgi:hypothetical protein
MSGLIFVTGETHLLHANSAVRLRYDHFGPQPRENPDAIENTLAYPN